MLGLIGGNRARSKHTRMKIVVVIGALPRGGAERVVSTLTREWSRHHHVVIAIFDGRIISYKCGGRIVDLALGCRRSGALSREYIG